MFENDTNYLDQHFLIDQNIINLFYKSCEITSDDIVLEIGAGKGVMTKLIAPNCKKLIVVEKDKRLAKYLNNISNTDIIYDDILNVDIPNVNKIVTSLPYSITEPLMYKLISINFDKLIMICGKKFSDSLIDNNSKLSYLVNLYFDKEIICDIDPTSFDPKPRVMSSLLVLKPKDINTLNDNEKIIRMLYLYRYMKVKNALKEILIKLNNITQKQAKEIILKYNIDTDILEKEFDELSSEEVIKVKESIN